MLWTQNNSAYIIVNWTLKLGQTKTASTSMETMKTMPL